MLPTCMAESCLQAKILSKRQSTNTLSVTSSIYSCKNLSMEVLEVSLALEQINVSNFINSSPTTPGICLNFKLSIDSDTGSNSNRFLEITTPPALRLALSSYTHQHPKSPYYSSLIFYQR